MVFDKETITNSILAYSLPGTSEFILASISSIVEAKKEEKLSDYDFVFCPFNRKESPSLLFTISSKAAGRKFSVRTNEELAHFSTTKEEYAQAFANAKQLINQNHLSKIVLSKRKVIRLETNDLYEHFVRIKNAYSSAFTYLLHIPNYFTWLGASPELLLEGGRANYRSRAIAGTRGNDDLQKNQVWSEKDISEHAFVKDHYKEILDRHQIEHSISENYTLSAGNLAHICADIAIHSKSSSLERVVDLIHPSPALSGFPVGQAIANIPQIETYNRGYYCGFLGPIDSPSEFSLFANIRCMEIFRNGVAVYSGGGIVKDSKMESEWEEAEMKADTLLIPLATTSDKD